MAKFDKLGEAGAGEGGFSPPASPQGRGWDGEVGSWPVLPPGWDRRALCAHPGCSAIPGGAACAGVGVLETHRGQEKCSQVLYVLISAAVTTAVGNFSGEQGLEMGNRGPNGAGEAVKISFTCPE